MAKSEKDRPWTKEALEVAKAALCPVELINLRNAIQKELDSEEAAGELYREMSYKLVKLDEPEKAIILRLMASQEEFHRTVLQGIVVAIDKKCGG
jgi:hypothetical protein